MVLDGESATTSVLQWARVPHAAPFCYVVIGLLDPGWQVFHLSSLGELTSVEKLDMPGVGTYVKYHRIRLKI